MRVLLAAFLSISLYPASIFAQTYTINTLAGGGMPSNVPATLASIGAISAVAVDSNNNVFVASPSFRAVFRIDGVSGMLTVAAGTGIPGYSGDGGLAANAQIVFPESLAVDSYGNLYIADSGAFCVRKVSPNGVINTVISEGPGGQFAIPAGIAVDASGNLFIAGDNKITRVGADGSIATITGNGTNGSSGDGGPAVDALLDLPSGITLDSQGNLYIADTGNNRVRKISNGIITTVQGLPGPLFGPSQLAVDSSGNLYVADSFHGLVIRESNGIVEFVAGGGTLLGDGGPASAAKLSQVSGLAVDSAGSLYIADAGDNRIRKVSDGIITTNAGNGRCCFNGDGGPAAASTLTSPYGIAVDSGGQVFSSEMFIKSGVKNGSIHRISAGVLDTVAEGPGIAGCLGGPADQAQLGPIGVAIDATGDLFVADTFDECIVEITGGTVGVIAGFGNYGFSGDGGPASNAVMYNAAGVAVDPAGNIYVADTGNNRIREISNGVITTIAGGGASLGDGGPATSAALSGPFGVAIDSSNNLYIADTYNGRIRKVSKGIITTVAGGGVLLGDGGSATNASLSPYGVAVDANGSIYIADTLHSRIRKVTNGIITTIAGNGSAGYSGDGGPANAASLDGPYGVAVDVTGKVYVADTNNDRIRVLTPTGGLTLSAVNNAASNLAGAISPGEIVTLVGAGLGPATLVTAQAGSSGLYSTQLSGVTVEFNGIAAPILYASATAVAAVVPYEISSSTVQVGLTYQGQTAAVTVPLASSAPALFTLDSTGRGQAAALNQDGSINMPSSPTPLGSIISLFATGAGQITPAGVDGKTNTEPLPTLDLPVSVMIGGQVISGSGLQFVGAAPGEVSGLIQINVPLPMGIAPGSAVPIAIQIGTATSPPGVTVAISAAPPQFLSPR